MQVGRVRLSRVYEPCAPSPRPRTLRARRCAPLRTAGHPLPRLAYVVVPTHTRRPLYMFVSTACKSTVEIRDSSFVVTQFKDRRPGARPAAARLGLRRAPRGGADAPMPDRAMAR